MAEDENLTISELARAVGKSETYVRQHVHRKHLTARKEGRNVSVPLDEAARWARERGLSLDVPTRISVTTGVAQDRTARMTVLAWDSPGVQARNLFTLIRHRRPDALGPWGGEPDGTWSSHDLGHELRLYSFDASFERCQALVDRVRESGTLEIDGLEVHYALEPVPRRHWAYRHNGLLADASMRSPFSRHSAELIEYWSFIAEPRQHWRKLLDTLQYKAPPGLARLGFPLDDRSDRVGNLVIAGAEDAIACDLALHQDQTLRFHVDADELLPGALRATVWASHSRDEVLRRELAVEAGQTVIEVASDVDRIGFAVYRNADGQCVDMKDAFLAKAIGIRAEVKSSPTQHFRDRRGRLIHEIKPSGAVSMMNVTLDDEKTELDKGIRRQWLDLRIHEQEATARREGNLWRFQPDEFDQAVRHFVHLLRQDADQEGPIYLADAYFMSCLKGDKGMRLYLEMFAATSGRPLRILCAQRESDDARPWWSNYPNHLTNHVRVRTFLKREGHRPGFHDRYLITPRQEIVITQSLNGWRTHGVTFVGIPCGVYRTEAERLWATEVESTAGSLLVREIA